MSKLIKKFDTTSSLFFALLHHKRYNMYMVSFEFKKITPEPSPQTPSPEPTNDTNKVSTESVPTSESELKNNEIEIQFIEDTIKNNKKTQNEEEIKQALTFALNLPKSRPDLVASLYALEGNDERALDIILGPTNEDMYLVMKNALLLLLINKSPEEKERIREMVKEYNPALNKYIGENK